MRRTRLVLFGYGIVAILAAGCATPFERQLGTMSEYHAIVKTPVIAPPSDTLLQDGPDYLIGIEKGDTGVVQMKQGGLWTRKPLSNPCQRVVRDASETINGHHDVNSAVVGQLMCDAIRSFAPAVSYLMLLEAHRSHSVLSDLERECRCSPSKTLSL